MKCALLVVVFAFSIQAKNTINIEEAHLLSHLKQLSSEQFAGRAPQSNGSKLSQDYIISHLENIGIEPLVNNFRHRFTYCHRGKTAIGTNIIGKYIGNKNVNRWIILTAHYDHKGYGKSGIFYGADDNASGTSALLAIASLMQKQQVSANILFLFTDAEEIGLKGSRAFVEDFPGVIQNTILNINIDMIGGSVNTNKLFMLTKGLTGLLSKNDLDRFYLLDDKLGERVYTRFRNTLTGKNTAIKWLRASDHEPFYQRKIPIIFFCSGLHENYHTTKDTYQNINKEFFINNTKIIANHILFLINDLIKT